MGRALSHEQDRALRAMGDHNAIEDQIGPRKVGGRYYSAYWGRNYTVLKIEKNRTAWPVWQITIRWDGAKDTVSHCTAWDPKRDRVIA